MPEASPFITIVWGIVVFVLWYFYRHNAPKNRAGLIKSVIFVTVLFFFVFLFLWFENPPPDDPVRIGFFPVVEASANASTLTWESIALAEIPTRYLQQYNDAQTLIYPISWLTGPGNLDSLRFAEYVREFAERVQLDFAVHGNYIMKPELWQVSLSVFDVAEKRRVNRDTITLSPDRIFELNAIVQRALSPYVASLPATDQTQHQTALSVEEPRYFKAQLQLLHGNEDAAVRLLDDAIAADSSTVPALNLLGELYLRRASKMDKQQHALKLYRKAKTLFLKAISLDPEHADAHRLLGEMYIENERWNDAEKYLRRAIAADRWQAPAFVALSRLHPERFIALGFEDEAALLNHAIFINPGDFRARLMLADYYRTQNDIQKAYAETRELLAISPDNVEGLMALGRLYMFENKLLNVLETFEKVIRLAPDNANAYYNLGIVHYHKKEYEMAIRFFQRAIQLSNHADSHLYLASIYEEQGDTTKAVDHLRQRIRLRKSDDDPFFLQARARLFELMSKSGVIDSVMANPADSN